MTTKKFNYKLKKSVHIFSIKVELLYFFVNFLLFQCYFEGYSFV